MSIGQVGLEELDDVWVFELAAYACLALQVLDGEARAGDELLDVDNLDSEQLLRVKLKTLADKAERAARIAFDENVQLGSPGGHSKLLCGLMSVHLLADDVAQLVYFFEQRIIIHRSLVFAASIAICEIVAFVCLAVILRTI